MRYDIVKMRDEGKDLRFSLFWMTLQNAVDSVWQLNNPYSSRLLAVFFIPASFPPEVGDSAYGLLGM